MVHGTRSACFRRPNAGECHRPVAKFLCGRNGFGYGRSWASGGMFEFEGAFAGLAMASGADVSVTEALGSVGGVVDIAVGVACEVGDAI
jgi:hypothetical protein